MIDLLQKYVDFDHIYGYIPEHEEDGEKPKIWVVEIGARYEEEDYIISLYMEGTSQWHLECRDWAGVEFVSADFFFDEIKTIEFHMEGAEDTNLMVISQILLNIGRQAYEEGSVTFHGFWLKAFGELS